jgi:hypothetical protein
MLFGEESNQIMESCIEMYVCGLAVDASLDIGILKAGYKH